MNIQEYFVEGSPYYTNDWIISSKQLPPCNGGYIGLFYESNDNTWHSAEVKFEDGTFKWWCDWDKPCNVVAWITIPPITLYMGKEETFVEDETNGIIVKRPWKNAKTEKPVDNDCWYIVLSRDRDGIFYAIPKLLQSLYIADDNDDVLAYIETPTPQYERIWRSI